MLKYTFTKDRNLICLKVMTSVLFIFRLFYLILFRDFSATFDLKTPSRPARANKTMYISLIKRQKPPFSTHFFKHLIFSLPILIDFINRHSTFGAQDWI